MTANKWLGEMQRDLESFMATHRRIFTDLLARQTAHGALLTEAFRILASCLPVAGQTKLLNEIYALAAKWKATDPSTLALADALERENAAEWSRLTGAAIEKFADAMRDHLRPS